MHCNHIVCIVIIIILIIAIGYLLYTNNNKTYQSCVSSNMTNNCSISGMIYVSSNYGSGYSNIISKNNPTCTYGVYAVFINRNILFNIDTSVNPFAIDGLPMYTPPPSLQTYNMYDINSPQSFANLLPADDDTMGIPNIISFGVSQFLPTNSVLNYSDLLASNVPSSMLNSNIEFDFTYITTCIELTPGLCAFTPSFGFTGTDPPLGIQMQFNNTETDPNNVLINPYNNNTDLIIIQFTLVIKNAIPSNPFDFSIPPVVVSIVAQNPITATIKTAAFLISPPIPNFTLNVRTVNNTSQTVYALYI